MRPLKPPFQYLADTVECQIEPKKLICRSEMSSPEDYPVQPPPPGQLSNFKDPESRGPAVATVCYLFISVMWPICFLRLYSKVWILRKPGWDDGKPNPLLV